MTNQTKYQLFPPPCVFIREWVGAWLRVRYEACGLLLYIAKGKTL